MEALKKLLEKDEYQWNYVHFKMHTVHNARQKSQQFMTSKLRAGSHREDIFLWLGAIILPSRFLFLRLE